MQNHDPYAEIIVQTKTEIDTLVAKTESVRAEITEGEELIPYYNYWVYGFGDEGIRAYIIDGILPALNARINYWLQFLIENKIQLTFDNKFEVTIERNPADGDPFVYAATSGGERRRINLAISQAFAHVMMISSGVIPSICSLDEVALNVDLPGVHGIYAMINELAKDRQIFVTTHDPTSRTCSTPVMLSRWSSRTASPASSLKDSRHENLACFDVQREFLFFADDGLGHVRRVHGLPPSHECRLLCWFRTDVGG